MPIFRYICSPWGADLVACQTNSCWTDFYRGFLYTVAHRTFLKKMETILLMDSVQAHINRSETRRLAELGRVYRNPYNFGPKHNWHLFLGLVDGRCCI